MAVVTNAYTTKIAVGNREQLENAIYRISPTETPLYTLSGNKTRSIGNTTFDFQTEKLPQRGNTPQVEAYVNQNSAPTKTTRVHGTTMTLKRDATVSGHQQAADHAGIPDMLSHQMAMAAAALKIDFDEYFSRDNARVDDDGTIGSVTEGLEHAIRSNVSRGVGGASATTAYNAATAGTARDLTEDLFNDVLQNAWFAGAKCDWALVGGKSQRVISKFTGRTNSRVDIKFNEVAIGGVTLLMSDFGDVKVQLGRNHVQSSVLIVDPDYIKKVSYRGFETWEAAKNGDATTKVLQATLGLQVSNEEAHALITDLNV